MTVGSQSLYDWGLMGTVVRHSPRPAGDVSVETLALADILGKLSKVERKHAPSELYVMGDSQLMRDGRRVSVIGSRRASEEALGSAREICEELLDRGVTVVSGLAAGIDTIAHSTAIQSGGRTIAVLGTPVNVAYPKSNAAMHRTIVREHVAVSQFPLGSPVRRWNFPKRNRTMALLSDATIIAAAGPKSGTIHQGWEALRLERPLAIHKSAVSREFSWVSKFLGYGATVLDQSGLGPWLDSIEERTVTKDCSSPGFPGLLRTIQCGTYFAYSPGGRGPLGPDSRDRCYGLKDGDLGLIQRMTKHMATQRGHDGLAGILGPDVTLVPMPGHVPDQPIEDWPTYLLAQEMVAQRLGCQVVPLLRRSKEVAESSTAPSMSARPSAQQHFDSLSVDQVGVFDAPPRRLVAIDDVITMGATMLGAVSAITKHFDVPVQCFAAVRTERRNTGIEEIPDPVTCEIKLVSNGRTRRDP